MFTENAREMVVGIVFCICAAAALIVMVRQYRQQGSVMSPLYFLAEKEEKERMRRRNVYHAVGNIYLWVAVILLLFGGCFLLEEAMLAFIGAILMVAGLLNLLLQIVAHKNN